LAAQLDTLIERRQIIGAELFMQQTIVGIEVKLAELQKTVSSLMAEIRPILATIR
jgi:hypothetical protein